MRTVRRAIRSNAEEGPTGANWRRRLHEIIFEADTAAGRLFDLVLLAAILTSLLVVMLDSVAEYERRFKLQLTLAAWVLTILFSIEYILRVISVKRPFRYVFSFFGIVDLIATVPTYISLFVPGAQYLLIVRSLRLLRIFRVLKLSRFVVESQILVTAIRQSVPKITVFLGTVLSIVCIMGTLMYIIEGRAGGFTSIPRGMYWAIVTLTTVGYGDIAPRTALGQVLASVLMVMGYGIIAVPTGIVSVELANAHRHAVSTQACPFCSAEGHDIDAVFCKACGEPLNE